MSDYRVTVTREGNRWLADVPRLRGAHAFARSLQALNRYVREVIVLAEDLPDEAMDSLQLRWDFHTGDDALDRELASLREHREALTDQQSQIEQQTARFSRELGERGLSVRDVAALLGVSPARAGQLRAGGAHLARGRS